MRSFGHVLAVAMFGLLTTLVIHGCDLEPTGQLEPIDAGPDTAPPPDSGLSCIDGIKDGDETDVDCGGSCSAKCGDNKGCVAAKDCVSNVCTAGKCVAVSCSDGIKNGTETDVDCGGSCPNKCENQKGCISGGDCKSGDCQNKICVAGTCTDAIQDGKETDIDCGGPDCAACGLNGKCTLPRDCKSGVCTGNRCQEATCTDKVQNGTETDVDCGGGSCPACADGLKCKAQSDCVAASFCNSSGICTPKEGNGTGCQGGAQCVSGNCVDGVCCNLAQSACNGCKACNVAGQPGTCANVPLGQDPHATCAADIPNCKQAKCAGDGTCNAIDGTQCQSPTCTSATETDHTCAGGTCTLSTKSCGGFPCSGNTCAGSCTGDSGCANGFYCDNTGKCATQKGQAAACNTTNDCKQPGCRECGSPGGCVDGFCCNATCGGACQACSMAAGSALANGTCGPLAGGSAGRTSCAPFVCDGTTGTCPVACTADSGCAAGDYCNASGVCVAQKLQGQTCNTTTDCKVAGCRECPVACADGVCCNSACTGLCNACSQALGASADGTCTVLASGAAGKPPTCSPYVCGGVATCPASCTDDAGCATGFYCDNTGKCAAQKTVGSCNTAAGTAGGDCLVAGCRECTLACVAGLCT